MDKYRILEIIGEGTYGKVFKAQEKESGRVVAIKKFKQREDEDPHVRKTMMREIKVLKEFRHDNIVNLRHVFREKGKLYLIFDFVQNTLLQELIASPQGLSAEKMKLITYQILRANHFLHENKIMHRDIKPENLLISKQGVVKLCDFGFARQMHKSSTFAYTDYVSTRWYRSPELLVGDANYTSTVDVWAIGCIFAEIFNGMPLFPGDSDLHTLQLILETVTADDMDQGKEITQELSKKQRVAFRLNPLFEDMKVPSATNLVQAPDTAKEVSLRALLKDISEVQLDFIRRCLLIDGQERAGIDTLLEHPLFDEEFKATFETRFQEMQEKDEEEMVAMAAQKLTTKDGLDELDPEALVTEDEKEEGSSQDEFEDDNEDSSSAIGKYEDGEESLMGRSHHRHDESSTPVSSSGVSPAPKPQKAPKKRQNDPDLLQNDNSRIAESLQVSTMNRVNLMENGEDSEDSQSGRSQGSVGPHSQSNDPNSQTLLQDLVKNSTFDQHDATEEIHTEQDDAKDQGDEMGNGLLQGKAFLLNKKIESPQLKASSTSENEEQTTLNNPSAAISSHQTSQNNHHASKQSNVSEKTVSSLRKSRDKLLQQIPEEQQQQAPDPTTTPNSNPKIRQEENEKNEEVEKQKQQQRMIVAMSTAQKRVSLNSYMVEASITEQIKEENSNTSDKSNKESGSKKPLNVEIKDDINIFSGQGSKDSKTESKESKDSKKEESNPDSEAKNEVKNTQLEGDSKGVTNSNSDIVNDNTNANLQEYQQKIQLKGLKSQNQLQNASYDQRNQVQQNLSRQSRESELLSENRQKNQVYLDNRNENFAISKLSSGTLPRDTAENTPQVNQLQQDRAKRSLTQGHAQTFTKEAAKGAILSNNGGRISRVNITFSQSPENSPNPRQVTIVSQPVPASSSQANQNQNATKTISTQEAQEESTSQQQYLQQQKQQWPTQEIGSKNTTQRQKNYIISQNESGQQMSGKKTEFGKINVPIHQYSQQSQMSKQGQIQSVLKSARENANTPSTTNQSLVSPQVKLLSQEMASFGVEGSGFSKLLNLNGNSGAQTQINSLQFEGDNGKEISAFTGKPIYQVVTKQYPQTQVKGLSSKQQAILKQTSSLEKLARERQGLHQNGTSPQHLPNLKMMNSGLTSQKKNNFRDISDGKLTQSSLNNNGVGSLRADQKLKSLNNGHILSNTNVLAVSNQPPMPQTSHATGKMNHTYQNYHNPRGQNTQTDFKIGGVKHSQSNSVTHPKNIDKNVHQGFHFKESNNDDVFALQHLRDQMPAKYGNQQQVQPIKLMLFPKLNEQSEESASSPPPPANIFNSVGGPMIRTTAENSQQKSRGEQQQQAQYVQDLRHGRITTLSQKGAKGDSQGQQFMLPKRYSEMGSGLVHKTPQKFMNFHQKIAHQNYLQQESDHMRKHAYLGNQSKRVYEEQTPKTDLKKSSKIGVQQQNVSEAKVVSLETTQINNANEYMLGADLRQGSVSQLSFNINPSDALSYSNQNERKNQLHENGTGTHGDKSSKVSLHSSNFFERKGFGGNKAFDEIRNSSTRKMHHPMPQGTSAIKTTVGKEQQRISGLGNFSKQKMNTRISHQNQPSFHQTMQDGSGSSSPPIHFNKAQNQIKDPPNYPGQKGQKNVQYLPQGSKMITQGSNNNKSSGTENRRSQYQNYQFGGGNGPLTLSQSPELLQQQARKENQANYANPQINLHGSSSSVQMSPMTSLFSKGKFFQGTNGSQPGLSNSKIQTVQKSKNDQKNGPLQNQIIQKFPLGNANGNNQQFGVSNTQDSRQYVHNQASQFQHHPASQIVNQNNLSSGENHVQYGHATSTSWTTTSIQNGQNNRNSPQTTNQIQNYFNEKNSFPRRNITNKLKNAQNVAARRANLREMTNTSSNIADQSRAMMPITTTTTQINNLNLPSHSKSPKSSIALGGGILVHTNQKGQYEIGIERTPLSSKMMLPVLTANPAKFMGQPESSDPKIRSYINAQKQQALMQASLTQLRSGGGGHSNHIGNGIVLQGVQAGTSTSGQQANGQYSESLNRQSTMSQSPKGVRSGGPATQNQMEINNAILMAAASHNIKSQMTSSEFNFKVKNNSGLNQTKANNVDKNTVSSSKQQTTTTGSYGYHRIVRKVPTQLIPKSNKRAKELAGLYL